MTRKAVSMLVALPLLALTGAGCSRRYASLAPAQVCASDDSLGRIKQALFQQAVTEASSENRYALDELKLKVQAKLVRPLVESYDHDTRKTTCTANLDLWLPVGVASPRELQGPIRYDAQPTADGRDVAFEVSGEETLASRIAGADLSTWAEVHAPRKPGLVVEVVPRSPAAPALAERAATPRVAEPPVTALVTHPILTAAAAPRSPSAPPPSYAPPPRDQVAALPQAAPSQAGSGEGGPIRVFVHVSGPDQLPVADQARDELSRLQVDGAPVALPPVRFVAATPRRTEVRCLKRPDCRAARQVGADLSRQLGRPITVVDMSATYGDDPGIRAGTLELWLPRGGDEADGAAPQE